MFLTNIALMVERPDRIQRDNGESYIELRPIHNMAHAIDIIIAVGILLLGIYGSALSFSPAVQYGLTGAGITCLVGHFISWVRIAKDQLPHNIEPGEA